GTEWRPHRLPRPDRPARRAARPRAEGALHGRSHAAPAAPGNLRLRPVTSPDCWLKAGRIALRPAAATTAARLVVCPTRACCLPARPASSQRNGTACPPGLAPGRGLGPASGGHRRYRLLVSRKAARDRSG